MLGKIYDISPIWFQNFMLTISGYQRNLSRYGKIYSKEREFLKQFDTWPLARQKEYQRTELIRLVRFANENSLFYKNLYKKVDIDAIRSVDDLKLLPFVDKEMLRQNINDVTTISRRGAVEGHTGGTTGKSLVVLHSKEDMMKRMAMLDHFKARVGFKHRMMKRATFNGKHIVPPHQTSDIFWRYNHACKQMMFSSFHITEANMRHYIAGLNRFKPDTLDGFFMAMCDIASYVERNNIRLDFTPVALFPTSETLTASGRRLLERVFKCKVYDQYASSEGAPFVTECQEQVLHKELASGVFEHFEEGSDEILVTSFTTYGTPLIRYKIGDAMTFADSDRKCGCGIEAPIVTSIQGRKLDFLFTADKAKINGGNVSNLFKNMPNALIRAQLIQNKIDEIIILLKVDKKRYKTEYDKLLESEFSHKFGTKTKIVIKHVNDIPREKSGKFRLIKNNVGDFDEAH